MLRLAGRNDCATSSADCLTIRCIDPWARKESVMPADSTFSPLTENNDPASPSHSLMGHGMSVLVVEDDDVMRNLLVRSMERLGFNVQQASNAKEALQKFDEHRFLLIMLDVLLP